jgi:uncharacterized protein
MIWVLLSLIGVVTGIVSGLLGIGGGSIIVPMLAIVLHYMGLPRDAIMHFAIGTSFATMVCTSIAATIVRHFRKEVLWPVVIKICAGIIIGVLVGAYFDSIVKSQLLEIIFGSYLILASCVMFINFKVKDKHSFHNKISLLLPMGLVIGVKSGILGVGGGAISVPFLRYIGCDMKTAAGTSSAFSFIVAVIGTILFVNFGWHKWDVSGSLGFVYLPAFLCIFPFTMMLAPVGAKLSSHISSKLLHRIFAVFLLVVAIKMFWL